MKEALRLFLIVLAGVAITAGGMWMDNRKPVLRWETARVLKFYDGESLRVDVDLTDGSKRTFVRTDDTYWREYPTASVVDPVTDMKLRETVVRKQWGTQ